MATRYATRRTNSPNRPPLRTQPLAWRAGTGGGNHMLATSAASCATADISALGPLTNPFPDGIDQATIFPMGKYNPGYVLPRVAVDDHNVGTVFLTQAQTSSTLWTSRSASRGSLVETSTVGAAETQSGPWPGLGIALLPSCFAKLATAES
jgi:hypothetical protein